MPVGGLLVRVGHVQDRLLRERFSPDLEADGQVLRGEAAAHAQRGELARLKEVVSPARLRLLRSLESMIGSGSIFGAALPMVGMTSTSAFSRAASTSWRSKARSFSAL